MMSRGTFSRGSNKTNTSSKSKKEKDKPGGDPFIPWSVPTDHDDFDLVHWAKKRQVQDSKQANQVDKKTTSNGTVLASQWAQYVCTIIKKCRAIENVQVYMDNSLSVGLKPIPSHLEKEPVKVKLKHSMSAMQLSIPTVHEDKEGEKLSPSNNTTSKTAANIKNSTEGSSDSSKDKKINKITTIIENEPPDNERDQKDIVQGKTDGDMENGATISVDKKKDIDDKTVDSDVDKNLQNELDQAEVQSEPARLADDKAGGLVNDTKETGNADVGQQEVSDGAESDPEGWSQQNTDTAGKPAPPRFGYTNSNQRKMQYDLWDAEEGYERVIKRLQENPNSTELETVLPLNGYPHKSNSSSKTPKRTLHTTTLSNIPLVPGYMEIRRNMSKERILTSKSEPNLEYVSDDMSVLAVRKQKGEQELSGMSVASIRTARRRVDNINNNSEHLNGDITPEKQHMTQKQVMLVLNNVTLKDGIEDFLSKNNYPPSQTGTLLHSNTLGMRQIETLISRTGGVKKHDKHNASHTQGDHMRSSYFPIADLLPAVDNSIRNSMPGRYYRSGEGMKDDRSHSLTGEDDRLYSVTDTMELLKHNGIGRPMFHAPANKTPLQRAKENTKKRLDSNNIAQSAPHMSESEKSRWLTSTGTLYNKSRPSSRTDRNKQEMDSRLSRKQRTDAYYTDTQKGQLHQISKTLSSRLTDISRQRNNSDLYDRAPVT